MLLRQQLPMQGHPNRLELQGRASTGSLGQGLGTAVGAPSPPASMVGLPRFLHHGDGEQQEGASGGRHGLGHTSSAALYDHDHNGLQIDGRVCEVMNIESLARVPGFRLERDSINSRDMRQCVEALDTPGAGHRQANSDHRRHRQAGISHGGPGGLASPRRRRTWKALPELRASSPASPTRA